MKLKRTLLLSLTCLLGCGVSYAEEPSSSAAPASSIDPSQKMREMFKLAEAMFNKGEYLRAKDLYVDLYKQALLENVENRTLWNLQLRIVGASLQLNQLDEAQGLLTKILNDGLPGDLFLNAGLIQSQVFQKRGQIQNAYLVLKEIETKIPRFQWESTSKKFYQEIQDELDQYVEGLLSNAERLFDAALYAESAPLYDEVLDLIQNDLYPKIANSQRAGDQVKAPKIRLRLAQAQYLSENYSETIKLLTSKNPKTSGMYALPSSKLKEVHRNGAYLLGLAYQKAKQFDQAIVTFQKYLEMADKLSLSHYDDVQYQLGYTYFMMGDLQQARSYLNSLTKVIPNRKVYFLSQLYLARTDMREGHYDEAVARLDKVRGYLTKHDPLNFEVSFLKGKIAFQLKNYKGAVKDFERALPLKNQQRAQWVADALYYLGWAHLKLVEDVHDRSHEQKHHFAEAEKAFELLLTKTQDTDLLEKGTLAYGQTLLRRGVKLGDPLAFNQAEEFLSNTTALRTLDAQAQGVMILAEVIDDYSMKEKFYSKLTSDTFANSRLYGQGWYLRAFNHFTEGKRRRDEMEPMEGILALASDHFSKAHQHLSKVNRLQAARALKLEAECHLYMDKEESLVAALNILGNLIDEYSSEVKDFNDPADVYYLRGITAGKLTKIMDLKDYYVTAEASMYHIVKNYPDSEHKPKALSFIGKQYFELGKYAQAEQIFLKLQAEHPTSPFAAEALFWAAESAEWQNKSSEVAKGYRERIVDLYPGSTFSDEAYFNRFTFYDYLQGGSDALDHLKSMEKQYPDSPFLASAYYLLGLNTKNQRNKVDEPARKSQLLDNAFSYFEKAQETFKASLKKGKIHQESMPYFLNVFFSSRLEGSRTHLLVADFSKGAKKQVYLEYAEKGFKELITEFEDDTSLIHSEAQADAFFDDIRKECKYGLSQVYMKGEKYELGEQILSAMLQEFAAANIQRGYLLSKIWYDLGKIAMQREDYTLALKFLHQSEDAEKGGLLSIDQRLDLWIQQSLCYKKKKELDTAMALLSKVINDPAVSSNRLKAMYLRSEIYEEQGRHELAVKQLEATSRKGGIWALKAKEKLESDYGFH